MQKQNMFTPVNGIQTVLEERFLMDFFISNAATQYIGYVHVSVRTPSVLIRIGNDHWFMEVL